MLEPHLRKLILTFLPKPLQPYWQRIERSPLASRVAYGTIWSAVGAAGSRFFAVLTSVILAHQLGKLVFGEFGMINGSIGMFAVFSRLSLGMTASKYVAELRHTDRERAGRIIALSSTTAWVTGGLFTVLLLVLAPWLATHTLSAPKLTTGLRIGAFLLLLGAVSGGQNGMLSGVEAFKRISWLTLFSGAVSFPLVALGAWRYGLNGAIAGLVLSQVAYYLVSHLVVRAEARRACIPIRIKGALKEIGVLWRFSIPAVAGGAMVTPVLWACSAMIANIPEGYAQLGVYNAANQWRTAIALFPSLLGGVALPMLSNFNGIGDSHSYRRILMFNLRTSFISSVAVAVILAACSPLIMRSYGRDFTSGYVVLIILCGVAVVASTFDVVGQSIASDGRMWLGFLQNSIWGATLLAATWFLRERGAIGFAFANLIAYGIHTITCILYIVWRTSNFAGTRGPENLEVALVENELSAASENMRVAP